MPSAQPSDRETPEACPPEDFAVETPALPRASKRLRGDEPSPKKDAPSSAELRMLESGGAAGKAVRESSDSTWNLESKRKCVEHAIEEAHDDENEDDSGESDSDDESDVGSPLAGSRFMDMRNLHEVSKNFCCKKCTQALVREVAEQRFQWLTEFS